MASQCGEFNDMLKSFADDLARVFPDVPEVVDFARKFDVLVSAAPTIPRFAFRDAIGPHVSKIKARDCAVFDEAIVPGLDLGALWTENLSDHTREVIWDYLEELVRLSGLSQTSSGILPLQDMSGDDVKTVLDAALKDVPENVTENIRSLADTCVERMRSGESMESVIASIAPMLETADLQGIENANVDVLSELVGFDLSALSGDGDDVPDIGNMLSLVSGLQNAKTAKSAKTPSKKRRK